MRRTIIPELLDTDSGTSEEIVASFSDLERIGRWFGGASTLAALIQTVAEASGCSQFSILDVGAGNGEAMALVQEKMRSTGIDVTATLLERSLDHIKACNQPPAAQARAPVPHNSRQAVNGDALALPFREKSFDLVTCSTFAHHLEPSEIVAFVNRALGVARKAVLINDLRRSATHLALVYMGFPLFRSRLTRHDGPASVRRAYTPEEMREILQQTAASRIEVSSHYLYRMGAIAWVS